ncbi:MAG: acetylornithine carbamoyltransferase [Bacteroidota bacterium]
MQQFLSARDVDSIPELIELAQQIKANPRRYAYEGERKTLINLFFNPSLRTRLSTEKAGRTLGFHVTTMDAGGGWKIEFEDGATMNLDTAEHIREAAGVLSQYADILAVRSFPSLTDRAADYEDRIIKAFVQHASVPVVSLESATRHPLQSLADCITIKEQSPRPRPKVVLTWAPHPRKLPQAVANSFAEWMWHWGEVDLVIANPKGMDLAPEFTRDLTIMNDQAEALRNADFVYAKNWSSYFDYGATVDAPDWQITAEKMALTNNGKFMHCLPVRRNVVVADAVLDGQHSLVLEQANNRTWAAAAVLKTILGDTSG